jgi:hypothetical protein
MLSVNIFYLVGNTLKICQKQAIKCIFRVFLKQRRRQEMKVAVLKGNESKRAQKAASIATFILLRPQRYICESGKTFII